MAMSTAALESSQNVGTISVSIAISIMSLSPVPGVMVTGVLCDGCKQTCSTL